MELQMPLMIIVMMIAAVYAFGEKNPESKKRCVVLISVILTLFSGLRSWWMGDLIKYYTLYRTCSGPEWLSALTEKDTNLGIRIFFRGASLLGISYDSCILIIAAFVAVTLGFLVFRYSPSPYWSYVMYIGMGFYLFTYSGLKQTIAMGFVILAAAAMFEGRWKKFVVWVLLGGIFHAPALVFLIAYPLCRQKLNQKYYLFLAGLFVGMFLFRTQIGNFLSTLYYDDKDAFTTATDVGGRFWMMLLILVVGVILRPLHKWDRLYLQVFNLMVIAAALQTMSVFDNNFTRLTDYYYQFIVLFMPMMLELSSGQIRRFPEHRDQVRYWPAKVYAVIGLCITLFALWYYNQYVNSAWELLSGFRFRWTIDPYSLYGA